MTAPTTPGLASLAAALAKVQAELPKLERDRTVEVQQKSGGTYSYSYVTLANLSDAILPLLTKHGLSFAAMPGAGADGKMCVRYHLMHESGEVLSGEFPISGEGGIQMIGGRITYARRYCLAAIVGVAADEDDEARLSEDGVRGTAQRAAARPRQQRQVEPAAEGGQTAQRASRARQSSTLDDRPVAQQPAASRSARPPLPGEQPAGPSAAQMGMLMGLFGKVGLAEREARLRTASTLVGRKLESAKDLTRAETSDLINVLVSASESDDPAGVLAEAMAAATAAGDPS